MQEGLLEWLQQLPLRVKPGPRGPRMPSSAIRGKAALQTEKTATGDGRANLRCPVCGHSYALCRRALPL